MTTAAHFEGDSFTHSAHSSSFGTVPYKERPLVRVLKGSSSVFEGFPEPNGSFHVQKDIEIIDFWRMSRLKHAIGSPEAPPKQPPPERPEKQCFERRDLPIIICFIKMTFRALFWLRHGSPPCRADFGDVKMYSFVGLGGVFLCCFRGAQFLDVLKHIVKWRFLKILRSENPVGGVFLRRNGREW